MLRRQLPVHSPMRVAAIARAAVHALGAGADAREALARRLSRQYRADRVVLCGSGTQALQVAIRVALRRAGSSTVALPAFTCFDVAAAAVAVGRTIDLYDLDPAALMPDLDSLARVLERGARVVVVTPLYGIPVDWDAISTLLGRYAATAIEDAAQGHGATWRGRPLGSLASLSVLSFGRGKGWSGGAGGALLLRGPGAEAGLDPGDVRVPGRLDDPGVLGVMVAQWSLGRPGFYALPAALPCLHLGETVYRDAVPPGEIARAAAAALEALADAAEREAAVRRANARAILEALDGSAVARVPVHPAGIAGFLRLPLLLPRGLEGFGDPKRAVRLGIAPGYPSVLGALAQVRPRLDAGSDRWPGGEALARCLFTAPTHSLLGEEERAELIRLLVAYRT